MLQRVSVQFWRFTDHGANAQNLKPKCQHNIEFSTRTKRQMPDTEIYLYSIQVLVSEDPWKYSWLNSPDTNRKKIHGSLKNPRKKVWVKVLQFDQFVFGCCGRGLWYHWTKGSNQSPRSCMLNKGLSFFVPQRRAPFHAQTGSIWFQIGSYRFLWVLFTDRFLQT